MTDQPQTWHDGLVALEAEETRRIDMRHDFVDELLMMIQRAGFRDAVVHGDQVEAAPTHTGRRVRRRGREG